MIIALAGLLTACNNSSNTNPSDNNAGSVNGQSSVPSTALDDKDMQMIADSDAQDATSNYNSSVNINTVAGASSALKLSLSSIGDVSAQFDGDLSSCASVSSGAVFPPTTTLNWACAGIDGSIIQTFDMTTMSSKRVTALQITGTNSSAHLFREYAVAFFAPGASRKIDDKYTIGSDTYQIKGSSTVVSNSGTLTLSGSYAVTKNDGAPDTITISSSGVLLSQSQTVPVCGGSINYSSSSGLAYVRAMPACPVVIPPPIIMPPIIFPIILPPVTTN